MPRFSRVLVVVPPHGSLIVNGTKKALVKSKRYRMEDEPLLVVEKKQAIGRIVVGAPRTITLAEFKTLRSWHLVSEEERKRWWGRKTTFYLYPVVSVKKLKKPVPVDYKNGAQVFVRPESLRVRHIAGH
ncbi:MAG: hypothetical protein KGL39_26755 [Patescibacteria group bacterium]|nr:hypothetical protein [Patescibacteria group bacterium]